MISIYHDDKKSVFVLLSNDQQLVCDLLNKLVALAILTGVHW